MALLHDFFLVTRSAMGTKGFLLSLWISLFSPFSQKKLSSILMMEYWAEIQDIWVPVSVLSPTEAFYFMDLGLSFTWYKIVSLFSPLTQNSLFLEPHNKINALLIQNNLSALKNN